MASRYDNIQTAAELVREVSLHGISLDVDDINRAADIFGHSPEEDLAFLANDIGRDNENGEPDPKGTLFSGRRGTRSTFYSILFHIWNWEDATRFWDRHTNPAKEMREKTIAEQKAEIAELMALKEEAEKRAKKLRETENDLLLQVDNLRKEVEALKEQSKKDLTAYHEKNQECIVLKARLYDLIVEQGR